MNISEEKADQLAKARAARKLKRNAPGCAPEELAAIIAEFCALMEQTKFRRLISIRSFSKTFAINGREPSEGTIRRYLNGKRTPPKVAVEAMRRYIAVMKAMLASTRSD